MFKRLSTDTMNTLLLIGVILLVIEIVFFNGGLVFSVFFSGLFLYIGWKNYHAGWGKVFFWIGLLTLIFTVLSMIAVRFLVVAVLVILVRNYYKSRENPDYVAPEIIEREEEFPEEKEPLLSQKFFGDQATPDHSYQWEDINIHGGFGDRTIDLSQTVLPHDEAVVSIRHIIGNIVIYVPYEVEVSVHHSALLGRAAVFQYKKAQVLNQVLSYQTPGYGQNKPRVKIITSMVSGDLEVKRI
ncbi:hypothetical protein EQV77_07745 [Halobacillus fulvus]|nr:hypothetical protein EQV77_07745 [Halobacillus fulvus]